jgi:hypothetical protein
VYRYIPPPQFYQGAPHLPLPPGAAGYTGPPYGAPAILHSPPPPYVHSTPSPPKKRGRERPAKNPLAPAKASAKAAQVKSKAKSAKSKAAERLGKSKLDANEEKENEGIGVPPLGSPIIISDSENDAEDGGRKQWTDAEKTKFFRWFLGDDEEGKANPELEQQKKNSQCVYKRVRLLLAFFFGRNSFL